MLAVLVLLLAQPPGDLAAKLQQAQGHMAAGRFREAVPLFAELTKAAPGDPRLLMSLGVAQHMARDHRAAVENLAAAVKLDPKLFPANLFLGLAQMNLGQPALAIEPLRRALELEPDHAEARQMLGDALYETGRYGEAAAELRHVTGKNPASAHAWYALGRSWMALARGAYEQLPGEAPDSAYALAAAGDGLMRRQQYRRAFVVFREALSKDPKLVSAHAAIAEIYRSAGHSDWAAREEAPVASLDCAAFQLECDWAAGRFEAVLSRVKNHDTPTALYWRGEAYSGLAYQAFEKLRQLPPSTELHRFRAGLHYEAGRRAQVVEELRKALELAPEDWGLRRDLAMALGAASDYDAAYRLAQELLRDEPDSPELNALAGDALLNAQKPQEAIPFFVKSLAANPTNLLTRESAGRAYMQTGAVKLALPHLEAAAPADRDGSIHYQLARAYRQTGQAELAKKALARYQELSAKSAVPPEPEITAPTP